MALDRASQAWADYLTARREAIVAYRERGDGFQSIADNLNLKGWDHAAAIYEARDISSGDQSIPELRLERNRLFNLVYWAIGTTEMAIAECCDDEEDTADAVEKLREMKIAVGMDPDLDSMEQDPAIMNRINLLCLNRPTR